MAILKIAPKEDWEVLDKYLSRGTDVVIVPEEAIINGSFGSKTAEIREKEGYVDYSFGGEPYIRVDLLTEYPSFQASELGLGIFDEEERES